MKWSSFLQIGMVGSLACVVGCGVKMVPKPYVEVFPQASPVVENQTEGSEPSDSPIEAEEKQ